MIGDFYMRGDINIVNLLGEISSEANTRNDQNDKIWHKHYEIHHVFCDFNKFFQLSNINLSCDPQNQNLNMFSIL